MVLPGTMTLAADQHLVEVEVEAWAGDAEILFESELGEHDVPDIANQVDGAVVCGVVGFVGPDEAALIGQEAGTVAAVGQAAKRAIDPVKAGRLAGQNLVEYKAQPGAARAGIAGQEHVGLAQAMVTPMHDRDPGGRGSNPMAENAEKQAGPRNLGAR